MIGVVISQEASCPVFGERQRSRPNRRSRDIRFYMNFNKPAQCNGRVTSWQYCYYDSIDEGTNQNKSISARFLVYRRVNDTQLYEQVPGSALTVMLKAEQVRGTGCASANLNEAQEFPVEVNDIIGACIIFNDTLNPLYMVGNIGTGGIYRLVRPAQSCTDEEGLHSIHTINDLNIRSQLTLHLSINIGTHIQLTHDQIFINIYFLQNQQYLVELETTPLVPDLIVVQESISTLSSQQSVMV